MESYSVLLLLPPAAGGGMVTMSPICSVRLQTAADAPRLFVSTLLLHNNDCNAVEQQRAFICKGTISC